MREIEFRGQRIDNGEWVYGSFVSYEKTFGIIEKENTEYTCDGSALEFLYTEVRFDTVSQFTGLIDKNGNKIFEGDKCKVTFYNHIENNSELIMNVVFTDGGFALIKEGKTTTESVIEDDRTFVPLYYSQRPNEIEIIGNIHENDDK